MSRASLCTWLLELPSALAACICFCRTSFFLEVRCVPGCHWLIVESDNSLGRQPMFAGQEVGPSSQLGENQCLSHTAHGDGGGTVEISREAMFLQPGRVVLKPVKAQPVAKNEKQMWGEPPEGSFCFQVVAPLPRPFQLRVIGAQLKPLNKYWLK